ncbi:hypothetical protein [Daejeonella lutea]|uniref:DNA alkylation repair enzyme n=1 Tax=Daejeonella lutea TaxID=572036 RepID=A0A1T5F690_9SPHI|nr:hypothetical protein [Daejeonella lutea]SKB91649.1 hypothetical protein SAMN05661099_3445 [Daejeonella lutea]
MKKSFLIEELSKPIGKKSVISFAQKHRAKADEVLKLCAYQNYEVAFRAAWILEAITELDTTALNPHITKFIDTYLKLANHGVQRHFTKILMGLTHSYDGKIVLPEDKAEAVVGITFEWLIEPQTPVAVKVNCMDILYNFKDKNEWIADELRAQIEFQLQNGSAALQSRGRRILAKFSRKKIKS